MPETTPDALGTPDTPAAGRGAGRGEMPTLGSLVNLLRVWEYAERSAARAAHNRGDEETGVEADALADNIAAHVALVSDLRDSAAAPQPAPGTGDAALLADCAQAITEAVTSEDGLDSNVAAPLLKRITDALGAPPAPAEAAGDVEDEASEMEAREMRHGNALASSYWPSRWARLYLTAEAAWAWYEGVATAHDVAGRPTAHALLGDLLSPEASERARALAARTPAPPRAPEVTP